MSGTIPAASTPRILTFDLETAPAHVLVFGQYKQNISNVQVIQPDRVISFSAKWHDRRKVIFRSEYHHSRDDMLTTFWTLMDSADIAVHFNGSTFDMPWMRRETALAGLGPWSPVQEVDLLRVVRGRFKFMSNKLENVAKQFGVGEKLPNGGFQLWRDIEVGTAAEKQKAWSLMRRYNIQDTLVEEALYDRLLPWIPSHPHMGLYADDGTNCCARCGGQDLVKRGFAYTGLGKFQQYRCGACGSWSRGGRALARVDVRGVA